MTSDRRCVGLSYKGGWVLRPNDVAILDPDGPLPERVKVSEFIRGGRETLVLHNGALEVVNSNRLWPLHLAR
jgi:hypothetical protein